MKRTHLKKSLLMTLCCIATYFLSAYNAPDVTHFYVSVSGNDENTGTKALPFKTISKAASVISAGSTVHVAPGTYAETILTKTNGTQSSRIRFVSDKKWAAKIVPPPGGKATTGFDNRGAYVTIDGFELDGQSSNQWNIGINVTGTGDSVINCTAHHIFTNGKGSGRGGAGILLDNWYGFNDMHALNNVVHHIGPPIGGHWYQGIYQTATGSIKNNIIYAVTGGGVHCWHNAHKIDIVNNTSFGNGTGYIIGGGDYVKGYKGPCDSMNLVNNIAYDNSIVGFDEEGQVGPNNVFKHNLAFKNGKNGQENWGLKASSHSDDVIADPQFINYVKTGGGNYRLQKKSPAVNAGTDFLAPKTDYDGKKRPRRKSIDIGAFEY